MTKTTAPNLDELIAGAPDDRTMVLTAYSASMLSAATLQDLATETFARRAKQLGKSAANVKEDFTRIRGYRKAQAKFDPAELERARAKEVQTRTDHVAYNVGGRAAREAGLADHNDMQPAGPLKIVALTARMRESETPEQRESILKMIQAVRAEGERLEHRARAASNALEELMRRRDKLTMIAEGDPLFMALPTNESTE